MNMLGLVFGFAVARGLPDASRIALVGALPQSPVVGLVLASALASRESSASTTPLAPVAPVVTATVSSSTQINLSWTESLGAAAYNVRRGQDKSGTEGSNPIAHLSDLSYSDTGLDSGTAYFYIVDAVDANGKSIVSSQEVTAATPD